MSAHITQHVALRRLYVPSHVLCQAAVLADVDNDDLSVYARTTFEMDVIDAERYRRMADAEDLRRGDGGNE